MMALVDETKPKKDAAAFEEALLRAAARPLAIVDGKGRILSANDLMNTLLGPSASQILGDCFVGDVIFSGNKKSSVETAVLSSGESVRLQLEPLNDRIGRWLVIAENVSGVTGLRSASELIDPLTGLANRPLVLTQMKRMLADIAESEGTVTVICIDLDGFDLINKTYGRPVGDSVLIEAAARIARGVRGSNVIGRLMEDCFVVVVPSLSSLEQINAIAQRLISTVSRPFQAPGVADPVIISASAGIAMAPENGTEADSLIQFAETAVGTAKSGGYGTYQFYTSSSGGEIRERRTRISRLNRAIESDELFLHYQPKVSLASGDIVGAEALLRWQDPSSGLVMPTDFIPLAEDAGLMDPIGRMVIETSCRMLKKWQGEDMPFLRLAANVSARQLARRSFFVELREILAVTGVEPDSLELEITESAILDNAEDVIRTLRDVRSLGVHLTADDFGTGYASLSYLRDFPLDGIKIDVTFVGDIDAPDSEGGLAAAVVAVGHSLGMNVVAEGVETRTQLDFLRWRSCDEVQGYYLSPPLPVEEFEALVLSGRRLGAEHA